jgi:hypothetical protein
LSCAAPVSPIRADFGVACEAKSNQQGSGATFSDTRLLAYEGVSAVGTPWLWTLAFGQHEDRTPTHGYEPTREAAMAAFAKSWRRE